VQGSRADTVPTDDSNLPLSSRDVVRAAWSAPATRVLVLLIAVAAAWETYAGTLLGGGRSVLGPALEALLWVSLVVGGLLSYAMLVPLARQSVPRVGLRLAISALAGLGAVQAARVALSPLLAPAPWSEYHFLRLAFPIGVAGVAAAVLLRGETRALARRLSRDPALAPLPALAMLFVAAVVLVSSSDMSFQVVRSGSAVQNRLGVDVISPQAWLTTVALLLAVLTVALVVLRSSAAALLLVAPVFATMQFATLTKIRYMHSAVQPLDLLALPEFMALFGSFFGAVSSVAAAAGIVAWIIAVFVARRRWPTLLPRRRRIVTAVAALAPLALFLTAFVPAARVPAPLLRPGGRLLDLTTTMGVPLGEHREMARHGGIVLNFLSELPTAFVQTPAGYSDARAAETVRRYARDSIAAPVRRSASVVNVVVYLVESLVDPADLGVRFTTDPLAHFRELARTHLHGHAIVPRSYGGSANTEFELLTGLSTAFLPDGSVPYRQYLRTPVQSLPRALHALGYVSTAVQADPRYYYDRERVYPLLGFDDVRWLYDTPGVERAERGNWPSDDAIVDAVIEASDAAPRSFVFAFPSTTHSPYDFGTYRTSVLRPLGVAPDRTAAELQEYSNAVQVADRAIARLIEHFQARPDSTIVVVLGDHLPPLSAGALGAFSERIARGSDAERTLAKRRVPLLVWTSFDVPPAEITLGVPMIASLVLDLIGAPRTGVFAVSDSVRRVLPVAGAVVQDTSGRAWSRDSVPAPERALLDDYWLTMYGELFGESR
jgi:phosphoglycerol transferase MdoB-like AlkP superfamily enzyme